MSAAPASERLVIGYAGFWWRVLAWLVDAAILSAGDLLLGRLTGWRSLAPDLGTVPDTGTDASVANVADYAVVASGPVPPHFHLHGGALTLAAGLLTMAYFVLFEASRWQATPGKRVCGLSVSDLAGRRIGLLRALARYVAKALSFLLLGIGFLMVAWTRRKQGLHDKIAGTLVLRRRPADAVFAFVPPAN